MNAYILMKQQERFYQTKRNELGAIPNSFPNNDESQAIINHF